jgi:hypothetical protein
MERVSKDLRQLVDEFWRQVMALSRTVTGVQPPSRRRGRTPLPARTPSNGSRLVLTDRSYEVMKMILEPLHLFAVIGVVV